MINKVSVVVPVYNSSKYLRRCLDSIIKQDLGCELEVLLINDGSTDDSEKIAREYADRYSYIKLYSFDNSGVSASRNQGIRLATGDYIVFVDSDDELAEGYIKALADEAQDSGSDIVYCGFTRVDIDTGETRTERDNLSDCKQMSGVSWINTRMNRRDWFNQVWCGIYRRKYLIENELFFPDDMSLYEDIVFSNTIPLLSDKISFANTYGYYYYINSGSLSHLSIDRVKDFECCESVISHLMYYCDTCDNIEYRRTVSRVMLEVVSMALYYAGEADLGRGYRKRLKNKKLFDLLKCGISNNKELAKYLLFKYACGLYYRLV